MTSSADQSSPLSPHNRVVLLDDLHPPDGFRFDAAVATTFTLGLNAALLPPLAFSSHAFRTATPDPISAMEAIRSAAGAIDIFCQAGMVSVPQSAPALLAFVEPMIHQVRAPRRGLFHPKVWCVRYRSDEGELRYRTLVLSRNLTEDRTWDVSLRLDSERISDSPISDNAGLVDLLLSLPGRTVRPLSPERKERVLQLAQEISHVQWEAPELTRNLKFHLFDDGVGPKPPPSPLLVVSPFIDDAALTEVLDVPRGCVVVSRPEELDKLSPRTISRIKSFVLDPGYVVDETLSAGDTIEGDSAERPADRATSLLTGLHAKLFVTPVEGAWSRRRLFLGSANSTRAAFTGNTELLVELEGHRDLFGHDALLSVESGFGALLEDYQPAGSSEPSEKDEEVRALENALRRIAAVPHTVRVLPRDGGAPTSFSLVVTSDTAYELPDGWTAEMELLTVPGRVRTLAGGAVDETFTGVNTEDVTPFLIVRLTGSLASASSVILASLEGDPPDRLDVILAKQIDSPEKFLRFLLLLLSLGDSSMFAMLTDGGTSGVDRFQDFLQLGGQGLLELILRALATKPDVLDDIEALVERMQRTEAGRGHLPEGFESLWAEVRRAREIIGGEW